MCCMSVCVCAIVEIGIYWGACVARYLDFYFEKGVNMIGTAVVATEVVTTPAQHSERMKIANVH